VNPSQVISLELAQHLSSLSHELGRQVGILVSRDGHIRNVIVGDAERLMIPEIGRLRVRGGRLRGLRLIHTHLRGEDLTSDDLNDLALLRLDLVAMLEVRSDGFPGKIEVAHILPMHDDTDGDEPYRRIEARDVSTFSLDFSSTILALEREFGLLMRGSAAEMGKERALIVGTSTDDGHYLETVELVRSADVVIAGELRQRRFRPHPKTVLGKGKLNEIVLEGMRRQADVAIFDVNLKPAQARAFEDSTGLKAIDRTQLILDIFAQRAQSRDGKLQVELAQLRYSLPRLTDKDEGLSRLTGGIGGRGPGETVLEVGRRRIRDRIRKLEKQIAKLSRQRETQRNRRLRNRVPVLSIIGYTNAGKTSLLNAMTESHVEADDRLFVTLDPTSRRLRFPQEGEVIITDTVGFLKNLPQDLVAAFKATLEELEQADLLLHVVDSSDERLEEKLKAVRELLHEMQLTDIPQLLVFNKCDLLSPAAVNALSQQYEGILVSAKTREGLDTLLSEAENLLKICIGKR